MRILPLVLRIVWSDWPTEATGLKTLGRASHSPTPIDGSSTMQAEHAHKPDATASSPSLPESSQATGAGPWSGVADDETGGLADWADALRIGETAADPIAAALWGLVIQAFRRLRKAMAACEGEVGDVKRLREEAAAQRFLSRSLAEWRRHKAAVAAEERIASRTRGAGPPRNPVEKDGSKPVATTTLPPSSSDAPRSAPERPPAPPASSTTEAIPRPPNRAAFLPVSASSVPATATVPKPLNKPFVGVEERPEDLDRIARRTGFETTPATRSAVVGRGGSRRAQVPPSKRKANHRARAETSALGRSAAGV